MTTGTLEGAFTGAVVGGNTGGMAGAGWSFEVQLLGWAVVGDTMAELQGGSFGHGFLSAGAAFASSPLVSMVVSDEVGEFIGEALVGGTVSELTGGNFGNGAASAAAFAVGNLKRITRNRNFGEVDESDGTEPSENFERARIRVIAALKRERLNLGLNLGEIDGGLDSIDFEFVESLDDALAQAEFAIQRLSGNINGQHFETTNLTDITIRVSSDGAITFGEALDSIGHELRHLSPANRALSDFDPDGKGPLLSEQELDSAEYGLRTRRLLDF